MKRFLVMLAVLLAVTPLAAQTYPSELAGERIVGSGDLISIMSEARWCPYSIPIDRSVGFLGEWSATLDQFDLRYSCLASVYGYRCIGGAPAAFINGMVLPWVDAAECYMTWDLRPDGLIDFTAVVLFEGRGMLYEGCFEATPGHPLPEFKFSPECVMLVSDLYAVELPDAPHSNQWVQPEVR